MNLNNSQLDQELPEPNPPLHIEDDDLSRTPTNDRGKLVSIIESLANKTYETLKSDMLANKRYAMRMKLSNRQPPNFNGASTSRSRAREEIIVKLPHTVVSWNDMDLDDILLAMFAAVERKPSNYIWFRVRVRFDHFISQDTRNWLDLFDFQETGKTPVAGDPNTSSSSIEVEPVAVVAPQPQPSTSEIRNDTHQSRISTTCQPPANNSPPVAQSENDDDDLEIICVKPPPKSTPNPKLRPHNVAALDEIKSKKSRF